MNAPQDPLRADIDRLAARLNSEEGIPMFLVCENLVPDETAENVPALMLAPLNDQLAAAFRGSADAWQRVQPDAPIGDVAKIVELLAHRDFAAEEAEGES